VSNLDNDLLPDVFINVIRKKEFFECQTIDLIKLNRRLSDACDEVVIQSDSVVQQLIKELQQEVPCLFRVSESVALVDMIASFVQVTTLHDYVRPDITGTLALKAARHPILDKVSNGTVRSEGFVPDTR
jgi:DNA mismatch repair protein MSH4